MESILAKIQSKMIDCSLLYPLDVLLVGATGTGKSSTINALLGVEVAEVGTGVEPTTMNVSGYRMNDFLRFHDSAGMGDGVSADRGHAQRIIDELARTCTVDSDKSQKYRFIDLVLVILDGSSRDLGTAFQLLESVVARSIEADRIIVAINQADLAMKGRGWNQQKMVPSEELLSFLHEQAGSVQKRVRESTGVNISKPVFYSAKHGYNVDVLLRHVARHLPSSRRVARK